MHIVCVHKRLHIWAVLSDEQMSNGCQFSLLNDEQMSNWLGVEHQPDIYIYVYMHLLRFLFIYSLPNTKTQRSLLGWDLYRCCMKKPLIYHPGCQWYWELLIWGDSFFQGLQFGVPDQILKVSSVAKGRFHNLSRKRCPKKFTENCGRYLFTNESPVFDDVAEIWPVKGCKNI